MTIQTTLTEREWFCYAGSVGHPINDCTPAAPHDSSYYCGWADEGYGNSPTAVEARAAASPVADEAPPVAPPEGGRLRDLHERTAKAAYRLRVMADEASSRGERGRLHAKAEGVSLALSYITEAAALREAPGLRDDEGTEEGR
jgi:hypothetical protein